ncbi:MAG: polysaccharide biosynthesis tyrosine autokinase [Bacteroidales bacterium]|nr:polysaccharide biosynthesis tyrosine autokinase [Bacteroidales bacterium]
MKSAKGKTTTSSADSTGLLDNMDYERMLKNMLRYWWVFVLSFGIAVVAAHFYNKTLVPVYRAGMTVLLKDSRGGASYELTEGFGLSSEQKNLENQRHIYSSSKMIGQAVKNRHFEVSYYNVGRFCDIEMYGREVPFFVQYDTLHSQPIGAIFDVEYYSDDAVKMHVYGGGISGYDYTTSGYTSYYASGVDTTMIVKLGQKYENDMYSFTLVPYGVFNKGRLSGCVRFYFNTTQSIVGMWSGALGFSIDSEGGTVAHISVVGTNMQKMVSFLWGLNDASVKYSLEQKNEAATRTLSFIKEQLRQTSDSLTSVSNRLKSFKVRNGYIGRKSYADKIDERYMDYDNQIQELMLKRSNLAVIKEKLDKGGADIEEYFPMASLNENGLISKQLMELIAIQKTLNSMKSEYDVNPYKKATIEEKEYLENNINVLIGQTIEAYDQQIAELKKHLVRMSAQSDKLPDMETELQNIEREYNIQDAVYTFLLQKESETLIAKASNTADNDILQDPCGQGQIGPNTHKNTTTAMAIGLMLPAAVFFLIEFLNKKVRSLKELKKTVPGISVMGVLPQTDNCGDMPCVDMPQAPISESFRTLRAKLRFVATDKEKKTFVISSSNAGEGKTFCAINIAANFALSGKRCLLMNYDLRRPRAEKALGVDVNNGITDYLVGNCSVDDIIVHTKEDGFDVMPSGAIPPNPSELIASEKNKELINMMKEAYDIVIIDTAPIGCVADGRLLEQEADAFLFVVRSGVTEYGHLRETIESLKEEEVKSLCLLFNGASHSRREYSRYGSYYGYGYGYSSYSTNK